MGRTPQITKASDTVKRVFGTELQLGNSSVRQKATKPADERASPDDAYRKMKLDYLYATKSEANAPIETAHRLACLIRKSNLSITELLQETANMIKRQLMMREVSIGIRGDDGRFRYLVMAGLREEAWAAHKALSYTRAELTDAGIYKGRYISEDTVLYLAEDSPYKPDEAETYNRPLFLRSVRKSPDEYLEGDYVDVWIRGTDDEIIGWIEFTSTIKGKLPDAVTIKGIEIMASMLGDVLTHRSERRMR